ncbi:MAG: bifunctional nicotinamide-nucleotide adenylyltransferase/Nudix hydroxylase [Sphingomonadales bacterium]
MEYHYLAFIGRFQPFHLGHKHVLDEALAVSECVLVLVGSANVTRSPRNPFTFEERAQMLRDTYPYEVETGRLIIKPLDDVTYNDVAWTSDVQKLVAQTVLTHANKGGEILHGLTDFKIGLVGYGKDGSSYYLKMFPDWGNISIKPRYGMLSSTDIRADYFRGNAALPRDNCPDAVVRFLDAFRTTDAFAALVEEIAFVAEYKAKWSTAPFDPVFVTVDAVVVQSGHVLLVRRGQQPGLGRLALPGGFVDPSEPLRQSVVRELKEETQIADAKGPIPPAMLASFIEDAQSRVFDDPYRSARGRTITHAFLFRLPDRKRLFAVKGGDDAAHAQWYRLGELDPRDFFEDHWFILQQMTGI